MNKVNRFCFLLFCLIPAALRVTGQQNILNYTIARWKDNKKAAASITLDDAIIGQFTIATPLLKKYDTRATFFITINIMQQQKISWQMIKAAADNGNEIANHTITHPYLRRLQPDSIAYQVDACNKIITQNIPSQKSETHAYPFGDGGNETDSERNVRNVMKDYCIGARATRNNSLAYNTYDFAKLNDDYYKVNSDMIADSATMADMPLRLDETIDAGGWYVPTYHGIENGWIITPATVFEKHLQEYDKRKGVLWIATFAEALKYHRERNCATLKTVTEDAHTLTLELTDTLASEAVWNEPLTINLTPAGYTIKTIVQGGAQVPFKIESGVVIFNVVPGKNKIVITKG